MQIKLVHKLQQSLDTSKKVIKFAWRHALTIIVVGMIVAAFAIGKISWVNSLYFCIGAVFLDLFKMQFKSTSNSGNLACEQMFESARRNMDSSSFGSSAWAMNPTQMGSSAWNMDPFAPGSSAYCTRNQTNYY